MQHAQQQVTHFMVRALQETPQRPCLADQATRELRVRLIAEELLELCQALNVELSLDNTKAGPELCVRACPHPDRPTQRLVDAYDGILDLLVVTIGTAVAFGLDLEPGWEEVHRSNMSKFIDGHLRDDGKWIKGPSYSPAQLLPIVQQQIDDATPDSLPLPA